jgi:hypothetical protein
VCGRSEVIHGRRPLIRIHPGREVPWGIASEGLQSRPVEETPAARRSPGHDVGSGPAAVAALKRAIAAADALLFATPEYNSSIPGVLKNAVDWASRSPAASPLRNKPVAVIGASIGMFGAVWAQAELRKVLGATGARVTDAELAVGHVHEHLDHAGHPIDPAQAEALPSRRPCPGTCGPTSATTSGTRASRLKRQRPVAAPERSVGRRGPRRVPRPTSVV